MSAPLLFMAIPMLLALGVAGGHLLRRRPAGRWLETGFGAGAAILLGLLALRLPLEEPIRWLGGAIVRDSFVVLGRTFTVEPPDRLGLAFIFFQAALLFLGARLADPVRFYVPLGLSVLSLLSAALFIRPFVFAALFLELAAALAVFMLAEHRSGVGADARPAPTRGALRFFVFMTLGMAFVLITGWLLEANEASPGDTSLTQRATVMLGLGFGVLLGVVPFHSWLPVVAEQAPPLSSAFVFTVMRFPAAFLMLDFLRTYSWLGQNPAVYRALTLAGGAMVLLGALFVFGQRNFGRTLGYAMLIDVGAFLLGVGLGTPAGVEAALAALALRGLAVFVWGMGLEQLRRAPRGARGDDFDSVRGVARRFPFAAMGVVLGLLSLVGFPLLAGFPARWALLRLLAQIHPTGAILLLIGMVGVALVCARGLAALLMPRESDDLTFAESRTAIGVYGFAVLALVALGVFPQWLLPIIAREAAVFTGAGP